MQTKGLSRPWWLLPLGRVNPLWWTGIGALFIWLDYVAGPNPFFPVLYAIPVILAAWYSGRLPAAALALGVVAARIAFLTFVWTPPDLAFFIAATIFRGAIVLAIGIWFARLSDYERDIHGYVHRLEGLLSICAFCKGIRNAAGQWEPLETYISTRSEAQFSHGLCPGCGKLHYPELDLQDTFEYGAGTRR